MKCGHMSAQYVLCCHYVYVCSVCTERTVLLVPLILLVIVNVLVDTNAQIKVTKARERPHWTQQAVITAFLLQQQLYVYEWPGCVYGRPVWQQVVSRETCTAQVCSAILVFSMASCCILSRLWLITLIPIPG